MVSIIWVNYNSSRIANIVLESLKSIIQLDYPEYEIVVVDNNSNDGSYEMIKEYLGEARTSRAWSVKILRLNTNKGYAGGVAEGFKSIDKNSRYLVVMNNDVILKPKAIGVLVDYANHIEKIGALNGVLLSYWDPRRIDSAGGVLNELLTGGSLFSGWEISMYKVRRPYPVPYADGPIALYNVKALDERFYEPWLIAYYDDAIESLKLWNKGYRSIVAPVIIGWHGRSLTFRTLGATSLYLVTRNRVVLNELSNSRFKNLNRALMIKRVLRYPRSKLHKAFTRGLRLARRLQRLGYKLDLYRAPIAHIPRGEALKSLLGRLRYVNAKASRRFELTILKSYS